MSVDWVAMLDDEALFPPDPESQDTGPPEQDHIDELNIWMTQTMSHFQCGEHKCFVCCVADHFARECPHHEAFCM